MPLLPAFLIRLIDKFCAIRISGVQVSSCHDHTPAHRRSAGAVRGLASHTELPKTVRTIPTYIVYDIGTQCLGHELLSGAVAGPAYAQRCLLYDFVTAELLARVALCAHRLGSETRTQLESITIRVPISVPKLARLNLEADPYLSVKTYLDELKER
jgi:hypothetical protein